MGFQEGGKGSSRRDGDDSERFTHLPWRNPTESLGHLDDDGRKRLVRAQHLLSHAWQGAPLEAIIHALRSLMSGHIAVHSGTATEGPHWIVHNRLGPVSTRYAEIPGGRTLNWSAVRQYALVGTDPYADRPVNIPTLIPSREAREPHYEAFEQLEGQRLLRVVTYDPFERLDAHMGFYRPLSEPEFQLKDHALLHALVPDLKRWLATAKLLGTHPLSESGLADVLTATSAPSWLLDSQGRCVFANRSARCLPSHESICPTTVLKTRLRASGEQFSLLSLKSPTAKGGPAVLQPLPPALRRVAELLVLGLSDKEIAERLDLSSETTRTYARRIYRRLAIGSRRDLMRLYSG